MKKETTTLTPEAAIVYHSLVEPESYNQGPQLYKATLLMEQGKDLTDLNNAIREAAYRKWPNRGKEFYANLRQPIRDGDLKATGDDGIVDKKSFYFGHNFLNAKSKYQPKIIDIYGDPITDENEIYGGCIVIACISFYGYDFAGNFGIGAGLRAICKVRDGEPIGGGKIDTAEAFADVIQVRKPVFDASGDMADDLKW